MPNADFCPADAEESRLRPPLRGPGSTRRFAISARASQTESATLSIRTTRPKPAVKAASSLSRGEGGGVRAQEQRGRRAPGYRGATPATAGRPEPPAQGRTERKPMCPTSFAEERQGTIRTVLYPRHWAPVTDARRAHRSFSCCGPNDPDGRFRMPRALRGTRDARRFRRRNGRLLMSQSDGTPGSTLHQHHPDAVRPMPCRRPIPAIRGCPWARPPWPTCCGRGF